MTFWDQECPVRGVALRHVHWMKCTPDKPHPDLTIFHKQAQCCHCGEMEGAGRLFIPSEKDTGTEHINIADMEAESQMRLPLGPRTVTLTDAERGSIARYVAFGQYMADHGGGEQA